MSTLTFRTQERFTILENLFFGTKVWDFYTCFELVLSIGCVSILWFDLALGMLASQYKV